MKKKKDGFLVSKFKTWREAQALTAQDKLEELALNMFEYIYKNSEHQHLDYFCVENKITFKQLKAFAENNPFFGHVFDLTKQLIAARIKDGWRDSKIDKLYAIKLLEVWDEEFKAVILEKQRMREQTRIETERNIEVIEIPVWEIEEEKDARA